MRASGLCSFISIPQKNTNAKLSSISSIGVFASVCRYFICVCPQTEHVDTGLACDIVTYQLRGWCRLEQWARLITGGLERMYIFEGKSLVDLTEKPEVYQDSIRVFDGRFTDERDRAKLVPTILGLWAMVLRSYHDSPSKELEATYDLVRANYTSVFPPKHFDDLLPRLEDRIKEEQSENFSTGTSSFGGSSSAETLRAGLTTKNLLKRNANNLTAAFRAGQARELTAPHLQRSSCARLHAALWRN